MHIRYYNQHIENVPTVKMMEKIFFERPNSKGQLVPSSSRKMIPFEKFLKNPNFARRRMQKREWLCQKCSHAKNSND